MNSDHVHVCNAQSPAAHKICVCTECGESYPNKRAAGEAPVQATTGKYVIIADGEGAEACVIAGTDLHESLHTFMCCCGKSWRDCETKSIPDDIKLIDDPDEWTLEEHGEKFCVHWPHETGRIMIYKLSERKLGAVEAAPPLPKEKKQ